MYQFMLPNFRLSPLQFVAIDRLCTWALASLLIVAVRIWRAHTLRKRTPTFDVSHVGNDHVESV